MRWIFLSAVFRDNFCFILEDVQFKTSVLQESLEYKLVPQWLVLVYANFKSSSSISTSHRSLCFSTSHLSLKCDSHMVAVWFHHVMNFVMINRNKKVAKRCSREVPRCTKQRRLPNRHISRFASALRPYTTFISPSLPVLKSTLFPPAVFHLLI